MSFLNNLVHFLEGNHGGSGLSPNLPQGTSIGQQPVNIGQALRSGGLTLDGQSNQLQVQPQHSPANLGVPTGNQVQMGQLRQRPQLGDFNPGYTPMQNSGFGSGGNPQFGAYNPNQNPGFSPQDNPYQQYWQ